MRLTVDQFTRRVHLRLGQLDLTTADLAKRLGVNRSRISQLINQEEITAQAFERLTVALEVEPGWWVVPIGRPAPSEKPDPAAALLARVDEIAGR